MSAFAWSHADFLDHVAEVPSAFPCVEAVALDGSRPLGIAGLDSDWDLATYYRDNFDPQALREVGWQGDVSQVGAWDGGVFNGGAWFSTDGRTVDVHYRDLDVR